MCHWEYFISSKEAFRAGNEPKLGNLHKIRVFMSSLIREIDIGSKMNPGIQI